MAKLTTESPVCRKIVLSFLDFLDSVEVAPGVDEEGLEVAKECIKEAFKITSDSPTDDSNSKPISLVSLFTSSPRVDESSSSSGPPHLSNSVDATSKQPPFNGTCRDELFGQLFGALEKVRYFNTTPNGDDDPAQLEKATKIFHDAITEMENSGCQTFDAKSLAETFKCQGNKAMQSQQYLEAIELYSFAISLSDKNAVFYCNRAAAYTQIRMCSEAIKDCLKSIEIDPNYSKAYSRLGLAYYAQGKYADAIEKGFKKALELDPHNESVKENIRVAEQRLREEEQGGQRRNQDPGMGGQGQGQGIPSQFSMPLNPDMMSMFMNMAGNGSNRNVGTNEPEIRLGGNINIDLGGSDQMPEEFSGALRSMMQMFGGGSQEGNHNNNNNPQGTNNGAHGRPSGN